MEPEIWRSLPLDGLEHYQVSNLGNVRNASYKGTGKIRSMSRCLGIGNSAYGFKWKYYGEEKPESWKRALTGKDTQYKPIVQIDSNGNVVRVWNSIKAAGADGFSTTMISACCNGHRKHTGGFSWAFYTQNGGNGDGSGNQTGNPSDNQGNSGD